MIPSASFLKPRTCQSGACWRQVFYGEHGNIIRLRGFAAKRVYGIDAGEHRFDHRRGGTDPAARHPDRKEIFG